MTLWPFPRGKDEPKLDFESKPNPLPDFEPLATQLSEVKAEPKITPLVEKSAPASAAEKKPKDEAQPKLPFPMPAYKLPESKLLDNTKKVKLGEVTEETRALAQQIELVMRSFGVEVRVVGVSRGPAVTMFELEMGEGVTVNNITARRSDLAIRLKSGACASSIRSPGNRPSASRCPIRSASSSACAISSRRSPHKKPRGPFLCIWGAT